MSLKLVQALVTVLLLMCGLMASVSGSHDTPDQQPDSHKTGNDNDNSMPYCQLNRLMSYLERLEEDIPAEKLSTIQKRMNLQSAYYKQNLDQWGEILRKCGLLRPRRVRFWIDTMCIPVNDE